MSILVIGSINMDIVNHVNHQVLPGETIRALRTTYSGGGKGANQAIAAAKAGADVVFAAAVGDDEMGGALLHLVEEAGLSSRYIVRKEGSSGLAFITVDQAGENQIILSPGANEKLSAADLETMRLFDGTKPIEMLLLQNEISWELNESLIETAHRRGVQVVLNPAPAIKVPVHVLAWVDTIILNETEAEHIAELPLTDANQAEEVAKVIVSMGVKEVLLTLGEQGSLYCNRDGVVIQTKAFAVQAVDTTAAGDTFIGAFAAALSGKKSLQDSLQFASAAAALAVSKPGAQSSIPTKAETDLFLESRS